MAKTHEIVESSVPQYDDGDIVTMRIGGYLGVLPYRQYPELDPADVRALNVGRRYLAERAAQSALAKAQKEGKVSDAPAFLREFLANWQVPTGARSEIETVGSLRADIGREYLRSAFKLGNSAEADARINEALPNALIHPKHGVEISRRLAEKLSEYVAPKTRDSKGTTVDPSTIVPLDLDAA